MNILIIGGTGFVGSHIADVLIAKGHRVRILSHAPEKFRNPLSSVDYIYDDLMNQHSLQQALKDIDAVVHSASTTVPSSSNLNPRMDIESNLFGLLELLDCMCKQSIKRILFLSSGGTVYGSPQHSPVSETHPLNPQCSYAAVKIAMENYLGIFENCHGIRPVIIRPANPYGPRQGLSGMQGVIASFTLNALQNKPLPVWGSGDEVRDFFHVTDLAELCARALISNETGTFNAGAGSGHSIANIIQHLETIHGAKLQIELMSSQYVGIKEIVLDIHKATSTFNWQPKISLKQGMQNYYAWMKAQLAQKEHIG